MMCTLYANFTCTITCMHALFIMHVVNANILRRIPKLAYIALLLPCTLSCIGLGTHPIYIYTHTEVECSYSIYIYHCIQRMIEEL